MLRMSSIGVMIGRSHSISYSSTTSPWPCSIRLASKLVPPTSVMMRLLAPTSSLMYAPAATPPAGPDSMSSSGRSRAVDAAIMPPLLLTT